MESTGELIAKGLMTSSQSTTALLSLPGRNVEMLLVMKHTWYFALPILNTCGDRWWSRPCFIILILKMCLIALKLPASSVGVMLPAVRISCMCHTTSLSPPLPALEVLVTCRLFCPCPVQKREKTFPTIHFLLPYLAFGEEKTWSKLYCFSLGTASAQTGFTGPLSRMQSWGELEDLRSCQEYKRL